jgi:hypothetical protein
MGNIGDAISDTAPAVGTAGPDYATTINALLTEIRSRLISRIPLSSLLTNDDLDLNGQALLNAAYITLANEAVSPVASPVNRFAAFGGNAWWVSPSGAIQLTDGAALNAAGVGGITGDYSGAGPMEFRYDLANTRYDAFANQSTNTWAYVRARGFDIAGSATSAFRARLSFAGGANVEYLLPATAPSATGIMGMTFGTNQITVGTADHSLITHAEFLRTYDALAIQNGHFVGAAGSTGVASNVYRYNMSTAGDTVTFSINDIASMGTGPATETRKITRLIWKGDINGGGFPTLTLWRHEDSTDTASLPTATSIALTGAAGVAGTADTRIFTVDTPGDATIEDGIYYTVRIETGTNNLDTYSVAVGVEKS